MSKKNELPFKPEDMAKTGCFKVVEMLDRMTETIRHFRDTLTTDGVANPQHLIGLANAFAEHENYYPRSFWVAVIIASIYRQDGVTIPVMSIDRLQEEMGEEGKELFVLFGKLSEAMMEMQQKEE